jgi:hypothetical protein
MNTETYPARLEIDYAERRQRLTALVRVILAIPPLIILALISASGSDTVTSGGEEVARQGAAGISAGLFMATVLTLLFVKRYPRWWFNFLREFTRFSGRVGAYLFLLTDEYPALEEEQGVHLELDFPDVERDLSRGLPLVKWLLAVPHYVVLVLLYVAVVVVTVLAWITILVTGRYPRPLFDFVVGVGRWALRVYAYAFLLITDQYPPFRLG